MLYGIILIAFFVALIAIKAIVERREYSHHQPDDEELLRASALEHGSAYEIFEVAGRAWSCSSDRIDHDFDTYLDTLEIPAYVRHLLRKEPPSHDTAHPCESRMPLMPI